MTAMSLLLDLATLVAAALVILGAALTLIGALGLLRFDSFYRRVHAPTLGTTLGAGSILIGSMVYFSVLQTRPVIHEVLITVFMTITTPVTLMLLVRAAMWRDITEGNIEVRGFGPNGARSSGPPSVSGRHLG